MTDAQGLRRQNLGRLQSRLTQFTRQPPATDPYVEGRLVTLSGMRLEVEGLRESIGARCQIHTQEGHVEAEVIGFKGDRLVLMCEGTAEGLRPGAVVTPHPSSGRVAVGAELLGRVIDGAGHPLDGLGSRLGALTVPLRGAPLNPMARQSIDTPMDVGIRAINSLLTIGRGQRVGLFAGSGVGKSTLLGMMTRFTSADVVVVGLVGERGREVREFVEDILGPEGMAKAVVVATPADTSPLMRVAGCWRATAIAEYYRSQGLNVLLLMDSLTRFAQAQREIGLAAGEPPVSRGYTPSVFSLLPQLIERTGNVGGGSITAIYTVLTEGDDLQDPIADATRAILDGHIVLSRALADRGIFPAIDIEASISRLMLQITEPQHQSHARALKEAYATYQANRDLIAIGAYRSGSDPLIDRAMAAQDRIRQLIEQPVHQAADYASSLAALNELAALLESGMGSAGGAQPVGMNRQGVPQGGLSPQSVAGQQGMPVPVRR
jgi:flagellum-specific ATP synthase